MMLFAPHHWIRTNQDPTALKPGTAQRPLVPPRSLCCAWTSFRCMREAGISLLLVQRAGAEQNQLAFRAQQPPNSCFAGSISLHSVLPQEHWSCCPRGISSQVFPLLLLQPPLGARGGAGIGLVPDQPSATLPNVQGWGELRCRGNGGPGWVPVTFLPTDRRWHQALARGQTQGMWVLRWESLSRVPSLVLHLPK